MNPFVAGNPVGGGPAFIGRMNALSQVERVLRRTDASAVVVQGQRRIGKTSVLLELQKRLGALGWSPVYFDLQDKAATPVDEVVSTLAEAIARALGLPPPALGPDARQEFRARWLPVALGSLPQGAALVLMLDEFDVLADDRENAAAHALFPYLRELLTLDPARLKFVFVLGRNIGDLTHIVSSLFKGVTAVQVSLLERAEVERLLRLSEPALRWSPEAIEAVWSRTHGHPFLTQMLCSHVWDELMEQQPRPEAVREVDVGAATRPAVRASENALDWLWRGLGPAQRIVASALAEAGPGVISEDDLHARLRNSGVRVILRELLDAPTLLVEWDLIEPEAEGWRFRVELFREWVATRRPLRRVQEELDRVEPAADSLYQAARALHRAGKLDQARAQLEQALELNPSHLRARELLGELLISAGDLGAARKILESLYEDQPTSARHRLVQVLLRLAEQAEGDDLIALGERVLELEPGNASATAMVRETWRRRGEQRLQSGDLDGAAEAFRKGGWDEELQGVTEARDALAVSAATKRVLHHVSAGRPSEAFEALVSLVERHQQTMLQWHLPLIQRVVTDYQRARYLAALETLHTSGASPVRAELRQIHAAQRWYEEKTQVSAPTSDPSSTNGWLAEAGLLWSAELLREQDAKRTATQKLATQRYDELAQHNSELSANYQSELAKAARRWWLPLGMTLWTIASMSLLFWLIFGEDQRMGTLVDDCMTSGKVACAELARHLELQALQPSGLDHTSTCEMGTLSACIFPSAPAYGGADTVVSMPGITAPATDQVADLVSEKEAEVRLELDSSEIEVGVNGQLLQLGANSLKVGTYQLTARFAADEATLSFGSIKVEEGKTLKVYCARGTHTCSVWNG